MSGLAPGEYIVLKPGPFDKGGGRLVHVDTDASLADRCRIVVAAHLEQYPPEVFGLLSEEDWESVVTLRHERTSPKKGKRLHAAMSQPFLAACEEMNPHLAESIKTDKLVWKDIVELRFPTGGLSRPRGMEYPWPVLVERVRKAGTYLMEVLEYLSDHQGDEEEDEDANAKHASMLKRSCHVLKTSPVNVELLQETMIGKTVKKFVSKSKAFSALTSESRELSIMIGKWKAIAKCASSSPKGSSPSEQLNIEKSLHVARQCDSWRELYQTLHSGQEKRQHKQGVKMRERRDRLKQSQPKIVKVRPAKAKHDAVLHRPMTKSGGTAYSVGGAAMPSKMKLLRHEAAVSVSRQRANPNTPLKQGSGFGNAVAFASVGKSAKANRSKTVAARAVTLSGNKRMRDPTKIPASTLKKKLSRPFRR